MANIKSQIKRNRQNEMRRVRNKSVRSRLKTLGKRFAELNGSDDRDGAERAYRDAARELDKAAAKGILHKRNVARRKSRLMKKLNLAVAAGNAPAVAETTKRAPARTTRAKTGTGTRARTTRKR